MEQKLHVLKASGAKAVNAILDTAPMTQLPVIAPLLKNVQPYLNVDNKIAY
jgi:hypothetical protein